VKLIPRADYATAALPDEVDGIRVAGELLCQIW
jgi:hypothetical protein